MKKDVQKKGAFPKTDFSLKDPIPAPPPERGQFDLPSARKEIKSMQKKTNQRGLK